MNPEKLQTIYFIVKSGTNERIMCKHEDQPLIIDNKPQANEYALRYNEIMAVNNEYTVMSVLDFQDKFGYR